MHRLYNGDCVEWLQRNGEVFNMAFADPPDNQGLAYDEYKDNLPTARYVAFLREVLDLLVRKADITWWSFNARWTFEMGRIVCDLLYEHKHLEAKPCVQTFSFGQHSHTDMGNNHRPLWRLMHKNTAVLYPDQIRVQSWRQEHGDKRADPRGRVPGDVFDFTRVTGNSKQRRTWHATQLNEGLVERCVKFSTLEGQTVLDPFGGSGTTLRVCKQINRPCTLVELSPGYCAHIAAEHGLDVLRI